MRSTQLRNSHIAFIRSLLRSEPLPQLSDQEWDEITPLLTEHKLCGLAYSSGTVPAQLSMTYNLRADSQRFHNVLLMSEYDQLRSANIIPLKGVYLLKHYYTDWSIRPMSDIDVLITHGKSKFVEATLRGLGYNKVQESKWRANRFKSVFTKSVSDFDVTVETHNKLFANEPKNFVWKTQNSHLTLEATLVHLVGHFAYQHTMIKLFWLYDIIQLCSHEKDRIDWCEVLLTCEQLGLGNALDATLFVMNRLLEISNIPEHQNDNWEYLMDWPLLLFTREIPTRYFLLKHALKRNAWDAIRYDLGWATSNWSLRMLL